MVGCWRCTYPRNLFLSSQDHGRLPDKRISKHSLFHVGRHSEDHGRLPDKGISKHAHEKRALTLKITVSGPTVHMSKHSPVSRRRHSQDHGRWTWNVGYDSSEWGLPPSSILPTALKKEGTFNYKNISSDEFLFYYSIK